jgi:iron complex outermembrane recepter protein
LRAWGNTVKGKINACGWVFAVLTALFMEPVSADGQPGQSASGLDEIVVTARKREENLQNVPISITAFDSKMLEQRHVDRLDGLASFTPNLVINSGTSFSGSSAAAAIYIRGIGQSDFTLTTEPGVGVYLDGAYIATSIGSLLDLADIKTVEVLRGPQGTLFGRNTIGGAINVTSKLPDDTLHGDFKVTTGSYGRIDEQGSVNLPIIDGVAAKIAASSSDRRGFLPAPNTPDGADLGDVHRDAARVVLRFDPSEGFEGMLNADYTRQREHGVPTVLVGTFVGASLTRNAALTNPASPSYLPPPAPLPAPSFLDAHNLLTSVPIGVNGGIAGVTPGVIPNPLFGQAPVTAADVQNINSSGAENLSNADLSSNSDIWGVGLVLTQKWDVATLKSISSYRDMRARTGFDDDAVEALIGQVIDTFHSDQFSQELQLSGVALQDRLNWLVGAYYSYEYGLNLDDVNFSLARFLSGAKVENSSSAAFSQLTFNATDKLSFTGGLRYTYEEKKFIVPTTCYPLPGGPATLFDGTVVTCAQLQSAIDPRYLNEGFLTFINSPVYPAPGGRLCCLPLSNAAGQVVGLLPGLTPGEDLLPRGTTSRSFNDTTPHANVAYRWLETLMTYVSYSEGYKSGGWEQRVFPPQTQVPSFAPETAQVYEIGVKESALDRRLQVDAAVFHTNYRDMQITVNDGIAPVTRNAAAAKIDGMETELTVAPFKGWLVQAGLGYLDARYTRLDADQNFDTDLYPLTLNSKLPEAPRWTTNLGVQDTFALGRIPGQWTGRLDWAYRSETYNDALNFPELRQGGYSLLNAALTYLDRAGKWEVSAFGTNITDKRYIVTGYASGLTLGTVVANLGRPAEWGLSVAYHFNK